MWFVPAEKNWMSFVDGMALAVSGSQDRVARYLAFLIVSVCMYVSWTLIEVACVKRDAHEDHL
jgi:hypothetical protein